MCAWVIEHNNRQGNHIASSKINPSASLQPSNSSESLGHVSVSCIKTRVQWQRHDVSLYSKSCLEWQSLLTPLSVMSESIQEMEILHWRTRLDIHFKTFHPALHKNMIFMYSSDVNLSSLNCIFSIWIFFMKIPSLFLSIFYSCSFLPSFLLSFFPTFLPCSYSSPPFS